MLTLIFPAKEASLPNVGPPLAASVLIRASLESEPLARMVNIGWLGMLEDFTKVEKMLL
jgi:hypothetical protein